MEAELLRTRTDKALGWSRIRKQSHRTGVWSVPHSGSTAQRFLHVTSPLQVCAQGELAGAWNPVFVSSFWLPLKGIKLMGNALALACTRRTWAQPLPQTRQGRGRDGGRKRDERLEGKRRRGKEERELGRRGLRPYGTQATPYPEQRLSTLEADRMALGGLFYVFIYLFLNNPGSRSVPVKWGQALGCF